MLEGHVFSLNGFPNYPWITNGKKVMWQKQQPRPRFVYLMLAPPPTWIFNLLIEIWLSKTRVFQDHTPWQGGADQESTEQKRSVPENWKIQPGRGLGLGTKESKDHHGPGKNIFKTVRLGPNIFKKLGTKIFDGMRRTWDEMRTNRCAHGSLVVSAKSLIETHFEKGQIFECLAKNLWF